MTANPGSEHSRYARRVRRRYAHLMHRLAPGLPDRAALDALCLELQARHSLADALRITRHLMLERLLTLDCDQGSALATVMAGMTMLAEFALQTAWQAGLDQLDAVHGQPKLQQGRCHCWIVGMGKLGARELNVSSDIDLVYVYEQDGETAGLSGGHGRISNQEYFAKLVRVIQQLLGDVTDHGQVFRIDLALRPNGNSGPLAVSVNALSQYFMTQGREWERFAWLKSRVVAGLTGTAPTPLRQIVLPFVFRRYLDYNVFESLRVLHRQIREHTQRRSSGQQERQQDIKLGRGGIREIEFTVQLLQVVRGGQYPELRTRPTLDALARLAKAKLLHPATAEGLAQAYAFLRRLEHRIQYLDDLQTHVLPTQSEDLQWLAEHMGFTSCHEFMHALDHQRERVALAFDQLLGLSNPSEARPAGSGPSEMSTDHPDTRRFLERLALWREHPKVLALRESARVQLYKIGDRTVQWLQDGKTQLDAALKMADWLETLLRRDSYLALLVERPAVHERLLKLIGAASWPARYLVVHPGVMDELAQPDVLTQRFDASRLEAELDARRMALQAAGDDDEESLLNLLRRAHHAEMFRTLTRDVEGVLSVEEVADELSALADALLGVALRWSWSRMKHPHRTEPKLGILAYGKLGGKELGYGSDLDLVFVYDDDHEQAAEVYAQAARKLIYWLTVKTGEGDVYEIDTALRPNGNAGLLVTRFQAYIDYQLRRGSNCAWTWELQAMTRARCVWGSPWLKRTFEQVRHQVMSARRDGPVLRQEIVDMRERVRAAHPVEAGLFDVKHSAGGMVDVEFSVQYLVLLHAAVYPQLTANRGNIALLHQLEALALLPEGLGTSAAEAYRNLRRLQHQARLNEASTQLQSTQAISEQAAVRALWRAVFAG
jgi:glutamate-ammonia-ligase adenylyltransferase